MNKYDGIYKWKKIEAHLEWTNYREEVAHMYIDKMMGSNEIAEYINQNMPQSLNLTITPRSVLRTLETYRKMNGIHKTFIRDPKARFNNAIKRGRVKWATKDFKYKRRTISKKLRFLVLERDNFKCVACGHGTDTAMLEVDHKIAICLGGLTVEDNLQTLCNICNKGKQLAKNER